MSSQPPARHCRILLGATFAFLLPLLFYLPALRFDLFILDDPSFISANPLVMDGLRLSSVRDAFRSPGAIDAISSAMALLPPSPPSIPAMRSRLALYRRSLTYREILGTPVPPEEYTYDCHL